MKKLLMAMMFLFFPVFPIIQAQVLISPQIQFIPLYANTTYISALAFSADSVSIDYYCLNITGANVTGINETNCLIDSGTIYLNASGEPEEPCVPVWLCSEYSACNVLNKEPCLNVEDSNNCNISFNGSLSDYSRECFLGDYKKVSLNYKNDIILMVLTLVIFITAFFRFYELSLISSFLLTVFLFANDFIMPKILFLIMFVLNGTYCVKRLIEK